MNYSNIITIIASIVIAAIFLGGVFLNLDIKKSRDELDSLKKEIIELKIELKQQYIEISSLTSPVKIIDYIEKNNLKVVPVNKFKTIYIKK